MLMSYLDFLFGRLILKLTKIDYLHIAGSSIYGNQPIIRDLRMRLVDQNYSTEVLVLVFKHKFLLLVIHFDTRIIRQRCINVVLSASYIV